MKARLSIRVQLLALVLSVIVPLTGLFLSIKSEEMADEVQAASASARNMAEVTAASTEQYLADVQNLLSQLAKRALNHAIVPSECDILLSDFRTLPNGYANLLVVDRSGRLVCSASPLPTVPFLDFSDRQWFQEVIRENRFVVGDPVIGKIAGKWVTPIGYPLHNADGILVGVLGIPLDLSQYHFMLDNATLPANSVISIVNSTGTVVAREPNPNGIVGQDARGTEVVDTVLTQASGYVQGKGIDGVERIYGFTTIPRLGWHIYVGMPTDAVLATVRSTFYRDTFIQGIILLMALVLAFYLSQRISRPITVLAAAAREVRKGRLNTRSPIQGPLEIAEVAAEFNAMLNVRQETDRTLRDREARLRLIVNQLPVMLWTTDTELRFTSSAGKGFEALSLKPDHLVGRSLAEAVHTTDPNHPACQFHKQALEGKSGVYELEVEGHIYECHVEPLCDEGKRIFGVIGVGLDITARREAEEALHKSEKYFRALIENSADSITLFNADGIVTYSSPITKQLLGYTPEEVVGTNRFTMIHPDDLDEQRRTWEEFITQPGAISASQYRLRRKDGAWLWVERTFHNLLEDPDIHAVVGNYRDIAQRKLAEEALRKSEELFRALIENSSDGISLLATDATTIYRSPGGERLAIRNLEEAQNTAPFGYISAEDSQQARAMWADLIQQPGKVIQQEYRFHHRDGTIHWYEFIFHNLLANPSVQAIVSNYRDITERKRYEEALQTYTKRLEIFREIDQDILAARSLTDITVAVLERITVFIPATEAHITLFDFEKRVVNVYGKTPPNATGESNFVASTPVPFERLLGITELLETLAEGHVNLTDNVPTMMPPSLVMQNVSGSTRRAYMDVPLRAHGKLIGTLTLSRDEPTTYIPAEIETARELADLLAIAITQRRLFEEVIITRDRLRLLSQELVEAQESASRRLAHELHDQVGTNLTALGINLNVLRNQLPPDSSHKLEARLVDSLNLLDETVDRVRGVMTDLRPAVLDDYGLDAALRWYADQFSKRMGLNVTVQSIELAPRPSGQVETALFRIFQEALTNVAKHSQAKNVNVTLDMHDGRIRLIIADDGIGFSVAEQIESEQQTGLGLIGMVERAESINGQLHVESSPEHGTRIVVEV